MMVTPLFIGGIGMQEVLLIVLVVLLFFGGKKIPELMKRNRQRRSLFQGRDEQCRKRDRRNKGHRTKRITDGY